MLAAGGELRRKGYLCEGIYLRPEVPAATRDDRRQWGGSYFDDVGVFSLFRPFTLPMAIVKVRGRKFGENWIILHTKLARFGKRGMALIFQIFEY